jgi:hypothetical protein
VALSDEQNAMLRLLASGEQGYTDIAALLGLSEDEVRAKVVGALAQLQAEGKPTPDVPPPLPGAAQPAAEVTPPEPEPVEPAPAADAEPAIAEAVAPQAAVPADEKPFVAEPAEAKPSPDAASRPATAQTTTPAAAAAPAPASASPPPSDPPSGGRTITLPSGRNAWLLGGGVIAAIVVIVVVILVASGGGGGGSSSTTGSEAAANTAAEEGATGEAAAENGAEGAAEATGAAKAPTEAELVAVDGSKAAGRAAFGRVKNKLALEIEATGLEPTTKGTDSYWIWLAQSPKRMLPLASTEVTASGKGAGTIAAEYEVPVEVLGYLASGTFDQITITRAENARMKSTLETATSEKKPPAYTGEAVLHGTITGPIVGLATREKEEKEAEGE